MQSGLQTQHSGPRLECCLARVAPCYVVCPLSIPTLLRVLNAPDIFFGIRAATAVLNGSWLVNAGDGWGGCWQQGFDFARASVEPHVASSYFHRQLSPSSASREGASAHCDPEYLVETDENESKRILKQ
ncbi:hypothetical protein VFPPC_03549 [Pochonia chlamydosporia 170]|uniref:Uncharacterized protein n=1 Tax=Pochonia chlamydosporia 170 TaxID=1380566 RepID=A0A179FZZ8_METCM|nr:hypothetical protein VFPPC_03549 [Pochonia chlamydosporia 170]OAQ71214.1 hypothetical protein VFPPC_03549 [Pochonia chlamydosporia 170]